MDEALRHLQAGEGSAADALLARLGFEYTFFLDHHERVALLPGGFLDYLDGEVLLSGVVAVGFLF